MKSIKDLLNESTSDKQSNHRYGFMYDLLFGKVYHAKGEPLNVLEIGVTMFGSGSFRAFAESKMVNRIIGVDIEPYKEPLLDNMQFIHMDAYNTHNVNKLGNDYGPFDIIIDDGIHEYDRQTFIMKHYEDLLADGGLLIIEDVSSIQLIREQCANDNVFFFDGWGNREVALQTFTDHRLFQHNERMLIKSKSEKLTDYATHDNKPHILRLPTIEFKDYDITNDKLAVSVPLYHPDLDNPNLYDKEKFQSVFARGAIWSGMSFIHNTDLSDNGVPLYFHIDEEIWYDMLPVFEEFSVPEKFLKKMELPRYKDEVTIGAKKDLSGKIAMALIDESIDPDVLTIIDGDIFTCATNGKLPIYDKLTQPILTRQPAMTYFRRHNYDYWWWVSVVMAVADLPIEWWDEKPLNEIEKLGYEKMGFEKEMEPFSGGYDKASRFHAENYIHTFPRQHAARDFAVSLISKNRAYPYAFSMWAEYNHPILELDKLLDIPTYDWEQDFIDASKGKDCFAHIRVKRGSAKFQFPSLISQYWDTFIDNVSRHCQ